MSRIFAFEILALTFGQKPWDPTPRTEQWWMDRHNQFVQTSQQNASNIQVVFMGSSSIEYWSTTAQSIWSGKYAPLGSINYGIGGDKIEHCLWRIMNGELDGLNPKLMVLYCGTNNMNNNMNPTPAEISRGITTTINEITRRLPNTTLLYMSLNPRGDIEPVVANFNRTIEINEYITGIHDGNNKTVVFDMFNDLILTWGQINQEFYQGDKLHLNLSGYLLWDRLWNSTFFGGLN